MLNKRADIGLGVILVIVIVAIFLGWLINEGWKECRVDSDCQKEQYCTSQFECKDIPVIEKTAPGNVAVDYNMAAWVIGISLIVAALIMKWDNITGNFRKKKKLARREDREGYIDMSKKSNAEEEGQYEEFLDEKY